SGREFAQDIIQIEQFLIGAKREEMVIEGGASPLPTMTLTTLASSLLDEDPPHGLRGRDEEVPATIPMLHLLDINQPKVSFVNQRGRLQRLSRLFLRKSLCR